MLRTNGLDGTVLNVGDTHQIGGFEITAFNSDHGPNISAPIDNLALEFNADGKSVLFLGDMAVTTELPSKNWDVILVPVGGSKVFTPEAALEFIQQLGHQGLVIPIHYHGRADREAGRKFQDLAGSSLKIRVLDVGESIEL